MFKNIGRALAGVAAGIVAAAVEVGHGRSTLDGVISSMAFLARQRPDYRHYHPKGWNAPRARYTGSPPAAILFMTRQIRRAMERRDYKKTRSATKLYARKVRRQRITPTNHIPA